MHTKTVSEYQTKGDHEYDDEPGLQIESLQDALFSITEIFDPGDEFFDYPAEDQEVEDEEDDDCADDTPGIIESPTCESGHDADTCDEDSGNQPED